MRLSIEIKPDRNFHATVCPHWWDVLSACIRCFYGAGSKFDQTINDLAMAGF